MKKTMLLLAITLAIASSAFARPCREYYRCYRRPYEVHHYHHRSHTWHSSDWGKFAAGAAVGWLVNEAASAPRRTVVYSPAPVYRPPVYVPPPVVYTPPPVIQQTTVVTPAVVQQPVVETMTTTPSTTIITRHPTPVITAPPVVTVIQPETVINTDNSTTVIRQFSY